MRLAKVALGVSAVSFVALGLKKKTLAAAQSEYELCQVQVVFRHGARTPLHVPSYVPPVHYEQELLVHSPKTHIKYELVPLSDKELIDSPFERAYKSRGKLHGGCYPGQLTHIGADEMYQLGLYLRSRYLKDGMFLTPSYQRLSEEIYTRSTNIERTIMSARCVLAGIFTGEGGENTLDIHISPSNEEIMYPNYYTCTHLRHLTRWAWDDPDKIPGIQDIRKLIQESFDLPTGEKLDLVSLRDNIAVETTHQKSSIRSKLNAEMFKKLEDGAMQIMTSAFCGVESVRKESIKLAIGPFVDILMSNMEDIRDGNTTSAAKMRLYSGHDTTLIPLLSALDVKYSDWPPYASNVILELLRTNDITSPGEYFVRLLYNGEEQVIGQCPGAICPFEDFQKSVEHARISYNDYTKRCAIND